MVLYLIAITIAASNNNHLLQVNCVCSKFMKSSCKQNVGCLAGNSNDTVSCPITNFTVMAPKNSLLIITD